MASAPSPVALARLCFAAAAAAAVAAAQPAAALPQGAQPDGDPRSHLQLMTCFRRGPGVSGTPRGAAEPEGAGAPVAAWPNDVNWQRVEHDPAWAKGRGYLVLYHLKDGALAGPGTGNCLAAPAHAVAGAAVSRGGCGGKQDAGQAWVFRGGRVVHNASGLCMASPSGSVPAAGTPVVLLSCSSKDALLIPAPDPAGGAEAVQAGGTGLCLDCGNQPQFIPPCDPAQGVLRTAAFCNHTLDVPSRVVQATDYPPNRGGGGFLTSLALPH